MKHAWVGLWMMVSLVFAVVPARAVDSGGSTCSIGRGDLRFQIPLSVLSGAATASQPEQTAGGVDYWFEWASNGAVLLLRTSSSQVTVWTAQTGAWANVLDANDCPPPTPPARDSVPQAAADAADSANACNPGGTMAGKCSVGDPAFICPPEVSDCQAYSDMLWRAGWYLHQYEDGKIPYDQIPDMFKWVAPPPAPDAIATCTVDIGDSNAHALGLPDSTVAVPLAILSGQSDPGAYFGVAPYGFDWRVIDTPIAAKQLMVYGPHAGYDIWDSYYGWWATTADCPAPTPPTGL